MVPDTLPPADAVAVADALRVACPNSAVTTSHPLAPLTTYRVGGSAAVFVSVDDLADLVGLASVVGERGVPVAVIGRGSNLLVADTGYDGLVVQLGDAFAGIDVGTSGKVILGASASLPVAARRLTGEGRTGFEWAVGVPGSVGGAVRMNAGGHGSDMAAVVRSVRIVDLRLGMESQVAGDTMGFAYRTSNVQPHHLVVATEVELAEGEPAQGEAELRSIVRWRRQHQPGGQNAGSVFTNPPGDSAGRLIDAAGLKGLRVGTAEVSTKHANFIQADPGGRASDIVALMREVMARIRSSTGVLLHPETRLLGFGAQESALIFEPGEDR